MEDTSKVKSASEAEDTTKTDDSTQRRKKRRDRIALGAVILGVLLIYFLNPGFKDFIVKVTGLLGSGDLAALKEYILSFGGYAAAVSFFLMMLQSLIAPIPAFLITFTNAALFGWVRGAMLSWTSAMAGAIMCFFIARILGRDIVVRLTSETALKNIDEFFEKHGKLSILIARLLPFVPFDIVSYAAGLTNIGTAGFITATGLGQLPATLIYSYAGDKLSGSSKILVTALLLMFSVAGIIVLIKQIRSGKKKDIMKA